MKLEPCPFRVKINTETTLFRVYTRLVSIQNRTRLYRVLKLPPRCIQCEVAYHSKMGLHIRTETHTRICETRGCTKCQWQAVGKYCDEHYMIWLMCEKSQSKSPDTVLKRYHVSESLVGKAPSILNRLVYQAAPMQRLDANFMRVIHALCNSRPDTPRVYALRQAIQRRELSEVAIVDVRTGSLVVHAIFDAQRAIETSGKLSLLRIKSKVGPMSPKPHVFLVQTISDLVKQLKTCQFRSTDLFVEYSPYTSGSQGFLDFENLHGFLCRHGYMSQELFPEVSSISVLPVARNFCGDIIGVKLWALPFLFRILFPQHPLADKNHSAAVDALQLAQITRLFVEFSKPLQERQLPEGLLQGLNILSSSDKERRTSNTIDRYLVSESGKLNPVKILKSEEEDINGDMELDLQQENGVDAEGEDERVQEEAVRKAQEFEAMGRPGIMRLQRKRKFEESHASSSSPAHKRQEYT
jgi:hypothetical protein